MRSSLLCLTQTSRHVPSKLTQSQTRGQVPRGLKSRKETSGLLKQSWGECGQDFVLTTQQRLPRLQGRQTCCPRGRNFWWQPLSQATVLAWGYAPTMIWYKPECGHNLALVTGKVGAGQLVGNVPYMSPKLDFLPISSYQKSVCPHIIILWESPPYLKMTSPCLDPLLHSAFGTKPTPILSVPATSKNWKRMSWPGHDWQRLAIRCPVCEHGWDIMGHCRAPGPRAFGVASIIPCLGQAKELLWVILECLYSEVLHNLITINFCIFNYSF